MNATPSIRKHIQNKPLSVFQRYLNAAPVGIGAKYSWKIKGGRGDSGVKFIDIEQGWILEHENLNVMTFESSGLNHNPSRDHGSAVLGVISMNDRQRRGFGITPEIQPGVISIWRSNGQLNITDAISSALKELSFGDVLLLELQLFQEEEKQQTFPVEIEIEIFELIQKATKNGVIVIEVAGNGDLNS